jgi:hypothetical protein
MPYQSVMFQLRPLLGRQAEGPVRVNPRYVVTTTSYFKPGDQVTDTSILLSTGDSIVVMATPTEVETRLKGGR